MTTRPLIVLSLEGLATAALGCYGSSWNETPAIDAIAASGSVWDRVIANSDEPDSLMAAFARLSGADGRGPRDWAEDWRSRGSVELITDADAFEQANNLAFDRIGRLSFENPNHTARPVSNIDESQIGQLFAAAIKRVGQQEPWSVLWLHSRCLTSCWDAPRDLFPIDEADDVPKHPTEEVELLESSSTPIETVQEPPPIFDEVVPPNLPLNDDTHPDLVYAWMRTYGCQVRLVDLLIEVLLSSLEDVDPFVVLLGTSGFRLGQGQWIGHRPDNLRSPDIRLPFIVSDIGPLRVPQVTGSDELPNILARLAGDQSVVAPKQWSETGEERLVETESKHSQFAVTTPEWFFVRDNDLSEHLYLKPDDVDDFNDVGRLRGDIVERLSDLKK